jgi:hypothetical protein
VVLLVTGGGTDCTLLDSLWLRQVAVLLSLLGEAVFSVSLEL